MTEQESLKIIGEGLAGFFKNEPQKITAWLFMDNLNFGGFSPAQLIVRGRAFRVAQFVQDALSTNAPPEEMGT